MDTNHLRTSPKAPTAVGGREGRDLSQGLDDEQKLASGFGSISLIMSESHYYGILRKPSFISETLSV